MLYFIERNFTDIKRNFFVYLALSLFLIFLASVVYMLISNIETQIQNQILNLSIKDIKSIIKNFNRRIIKASGNQSVVEFLMNNKTFRKDLESDFEKLITQDIKYIYLIYKDKQGKYRFLIDGSLKDKASLGEVFQPLPEELKFLKNVYLSKKIFIEIHKEINTLGFTLIDPIIKKYRVEGVIFVDFSTARFQKIKTIINWLRSLLLITSGIAFFLLTVSFFVSIKTYSYRKKAYIDSLTGLYNRNYLNDLNLNFREYTVAMADIDDFKKINDTYGHDAGDIVLKQIALIMKKNVREKEDFVIRFGGEEFLLLLKKKHNFKELIALERILNTIREIEIPIEKNKKIKTTISIGVDLEDNQGNSLFERIKRADFALYHAKTTGKDKIEIYIETFKKKLTILNIKRVLQEKRLVYLYQPILSLKDLKILGYQVLVNFKFEENRLVSSEQYFPVLENTFLEEDFVKTILYHFSELLKKVNHTNLFFKLSINNILNKNILKLLKEVPEDVRRRLGINLIGFKVNTLPENLVNNLLKLKKDYNYILGIDDFGESFSNLLELIKISADYIKFSCRLIKNIENNPDASFIEAANLFCKKVNIKVIAKCIEDEDTLNLVKTLNIDYGEGFYLGKPLTEEEFKKLFV